MHTRGKGPVSGSLLGSSSSSSSHTPYVDVRPAAGSSSLKVVPSPSLPDHQRKKEVTTPIGIPNCCICYDDLPDKANSVRCSSKSRGARTSITHYCCKEDFENYVKSKLTSLQEFDSLMTADRVAIACIDKSCANRYDMKTPYLFLSESTLMEFQEMVKKEVESRVIREQQAQLQKQLEQERMQSEFTRKTNQLIKTIRDEILTLSCPHCQAAFVDFEGCFALNCSRCKGNFCAWCLSRQPNSAVCHQHVAACPEKSEKKRDVFFSKAVFEKHHQKRNLKRMNDLLADGDNRNLIVAVKDQIGPQLSLHGFSMDGTGKLAISKKAGTETPGKRGKGAQPPAAAGALRPDAHRPLAVPVGVGEMQAVLDGLLMRLNGQLFGEEDDGSDGDFSDDEEDFMMPFDFNFGVPPFGPPVNRPRFDPAREAIRRNEVAARTLADAAARRQRDRDQYRQRQELVTQERNAVFERQQAERRNRGGLDQEMEALRADLLRGPPPRLPFMPPPPVLVMQPIGKDEVIDLVGPSARGPAPRLGKMRPGEIICVISDDEDDVRPVKKARYPAASSSSSSSSKPVSVGAPTAAMKHPQRGATSSSSAVKGGSGKGTVIEIE